MPASAPSSLRSGAVFVAPIMAAISNMTLPVSGFVGMEVIERPFPTRWNRSVVAAARIIAIVHVAVKAVPAAKPWASSDEQTAVEPVGSIVTIWRAAIRCVVEVTVGTVRGDPDVDANLSRCTGGNRGRQAYSSYC